MKTIYICGLTLCGKGLLRMLLDGHPSIAACPFQGFGVGFFNGSFEGFLKRLQNRPLGDRVQLQNSDTLTIQIRHNNTMSVVRQSEVINFILSGPNGFKHLIEASLRGNIRAGPHQGKQVFVPFDCDYLEVVSTFQSQLTAGDDFDAKKLQYLLYSSFLSAWKNRKCTEREPEYFLVSTQNRLRTLEMCLSTDPTSRVLAMDRDPAARAFGNARQIANKFDRYKGIDQVDVAALGKNKYLIVMPPRLFSIDFLKEARLYRQSIDRLARHHQNLFVVRFETLIENTRDTMESVAQHLCIPRNESLFEATLNWHPIDSDELNITNKIHDNPTGVLSLTQMEVIRLAAGVALGHSNRALKQWTRFVYRVNMAVYRIHKTFIWINALARR